MRLPLYSVCPISRVHNLGCLGSDDISRRGAAYRVGRRAGVLSCPNAGGNETAERLTPRVASGPLSKTSQQSWGKNPRQAARPQLPKVSAHCSTLPQLDSALSLSG